MRTIASPCFLAFFAATILSPAVLATDREVVSTEDAFFSYDDGRIGYEELEDLLRLIEGGETEEACALWESYGGDPCRKTLAERLTAWKFHGKALASVSLDSAGNVMNGRGGVVLGLGRFSSEARFVSDGRESPAVERWRVRYADRKSFATLGRLTAADLGSAISIGKMDGFAGLVDSRFWEAGALLLTDSSSGFRFGLGDRSRLRVSGLGTILPDGFRDAFVRVRSPGIDGSVAYSRDWRGPLFYLAASTSERSSASFRFRLYAHADDFWNGDSLSGFFRLPSSVVKSRAWWSSSARFAWTDWKFRWDERVAVSADTGKIRSAFDFSAFRRKRSEASVGGGVRVLAVGDSAVATLSASGGLQISFADSLFAEYRLFPKMPWRKTLFEIRPGVQVKAGDAAVFRLVWIARGPGRTLPLTIRGETRMRFSSRCSGRVSTEFRGDRLPTMALRRLGVEISGNW